MRLRLEEDGIVALFTGQMPHGWETDDPELLGRHMTRLSWVTYRIVWANPRTQSPRYRPEVGGRAAAWPYCDAMVSAHNLDALDDLLAALS